MLITMTVGGWRALPVFAHVSQALTNLYLLSAVLLQGTPILQATGANRAQINGTVVVPLQVRGIRHDALYWQQHAPEILLA
jgi:hypothetical protein